MIRESRSKVEIGEGADARTILRPVARDLGRLRFSTDVRSGRLVVKAVDDFAGVSVGKYVRTRFEKVYIDYREEWIREADEALLHAIYIQIAVPNLELDATDVVGLHFQPSVDHEVPSPGDRIPTDDQKRWVRGPHAHVYAGTAVDRCHFFLGDDSRRRRDVWGRSSVAKQMRSHLLMTLDQVHEYLV